MKPCLWETNQVQGDKQTESKLMKQDVPKQRKSGHADIT